jgi:hypothetical protein
MKAGDLLIDEREIVQSFVRFSSTIPPTIIIADLALNVTGDVPLKPRLTPRFPEGAFCRRSGSRG